ncbi:hypothetical protein [Actinomadura rugatobispora]|uniref:Fibronectin type-III domain-containing protein n=1 Tax=Actinomadura rugatobispora TaxID=1994 RepID=A0ABW1A6V0_9ACTN|nr:hypothetical protein GCM10010200_048020 [Actinomadura rugatobispora]
MTLLTYTVLTDPAPLEASRAGQSNSTGTVYLVVTNTDRIAAHWSENKVTVPVGDGADDLTRDITKITATAKYHSLKTGAQPLKVQPQATTKSFQVTDPSSKSIPFAAGDYLVLKLEGVPVAAAAGLAVLTVTEAASRKAGAKASTSVAAVPLVKTAAKQAPAPSNFRPDKAMVDDGDSIVLRWDGPADWKYTINSPDGTPATPPVTTPGQWKPNPGTGPKRDSTYTLIATDPTGREHFLTTTVQLRTPTFETGILTPQVQGTTASTGILALTTDGVRVANTSGGEKTILADKITVNQVRAERFQGLSYTGSLTFTGDGVEISSSYNTQGEVVADRVVVNRVNATRVQGKSTTDGWISFPESGIQVSHGAYNDPPRIGAVYAESGIYQRQFAPGQENRWIRLSDGGEISLQQRSTDGTDSYARLTVSRLETSTSQW